MNRSKVTILIVALFAFACSEPNETNLQEFTNETFADLDISTIQSWKPLMKVCLVVPLVEGLLVKL